MTPQTVQYKELSESGNHDREFGQFESDWRRPVSESSLLLTEPIHGVGAGRCSWQAHSVLTSTRCFSQSSGSG